MAHMVHLTTCGWASHEPFDYTTLMLKLPTRCCNAISGDGGGVSTYAIKFYFHHENNFLLLVHRFLALKNKNFWEAFSTLNGDLYAGRWLARQWRQTEFFSLFLFFIFVFSHSASCLGMHQWFDATPMSVFT